MRTLQELLHLEFIMPWGKKDNKIKAKGKENDNDVEVVCRLCCGSGFPAVNISCYVDEINVANSGEDREVV